MTAAMEEMDAVPLDFLKSYSEDEGEGLLPQFGGERVKVPSVSPDQIKSTPAKVASNASEPQPKRKRRSPKVPWKKPKDMPRRPLSAYNLFFQRERERMVKDSERKQAASNNDLTKSSPIADSIPSSNSNKRGMKASQGRKGRAHVKSTGIGFANMAKTIAARWKDIDHETRAEFESLAATEKERYNKEMVVWRSKKKIEKEISEKTRSIDEEIRASMLEAEPNFMPSSSEPSTFARRASLMTSSEPSSFIRPTFMRRLSDPYPETSHNMELYRHRQHMFNSSFTRACLAQMMQASLNNEARVEPFNLPSLNNSLNSIDCELENTFEEEPSDSLRTFSDSLLDDRLYDIRPCEDIVAEVASLRNEQLKQQPLPVFGAAQSSLRALGTTLDDDTVDFLTQLKFEH